MQKTITILHITDQPDGSILVQTTAGTYIPKQQATPARTLAYQWLTGLPPEVRVQYWHDQDKAIELVRELLHPEGYYHAVEPQVRRTAQRVLETTGEHWQSPIDAEAAA